MNKQRGIVLTAYIAAGAAVVIALLVAAVWVQTARLSTEKAEHATFVTQVETLGKAQLAENAKTVKESKRINDAKIKALETRLASTRAQYERLRLSSGSSGVPTVPATAVLADNAARDNQLLGLLRAAQEQADRLVELQAWAAEQGKLKP